MATAINTIKHYTAYETISVPECNEGDVVLQHGGLFRLQNRRDWDDGETVTFDGVYLGDTFSDQVCGIPEHWRENKPRTTDRGGCNHGYWQVQGNRNAKICRITDDRDQYYHGWADEEYGKPDWRHEPALEAVEVRNYTWAVRPAGQLGTCGFHPVAWTVEYVNAKTGELAIAAVRKAADLQRRQNEVALQHGAEERVEPHITF